MKYVYPGFYRRWRGLLQSLERCGMHAPLIFFEDRKYQMCSSGQLSGDFANAWSFRCQNGCGAEPPAALVTLFVL